MNHSMSDEVKPKKVNWFKRILFLVKVFVLIIIMLLSGVVGAFAATQVNQYNFQSERDRFKNQDDTIASLRKTVDDLETQNNSVIAENQGLKEQLKSESDQKLDAEKSKQLQFEVKALGKRLMTFQLVNPPVYFEFDNSYGDTMVEAHPAEFSKDSRAEGIEISFSKTTLHITIEPWKISGRGLPQISTSETTTADKKKAVITVLQDESKLYTVNATITDDTKKDKPDALKVLITKNSTQDSLEATIEEIRNLVRSMEIDFTKL